MDTKKPNTAFVWQVVQYICRTKQKFLERATLILWEFLHQNMEIRIQYENLFS